MKMKKIQIKEEQLLDILKALADETRLRILSQIIKGEMCVCEIEQCLNLTQSNASRHMTILKKAGILESYKTAQWTYYKISDEFTNENKELYDFLITKLKEMPCYQSDCAAFEKCKLQDLCNNKN
jgi:ArsR family transcriptional regulator